MALKFSDIYTRNETIAGFSHLTPKEKTLVKNNASTILRRLNHLQCPYHPKSIISVFMSLKSGQLTTTLYPCCSSFSAVAQQILPKHTHAFELVLLEDHGAILN
jgi:hypothetical protein